jgi:hypothetical protein
MQIRASVLCQNLETRWHNKYPLNGFSFQKLDAFALNLIVLIAMIFLLFKFKIYSALRSIYLID